MEYLQNCHFSAGVFFNLLLASRKKPVQNQETCLKDLLYIFDRSAKGLRGNSLKTMASNFRNCSLKSNSEYIRFGDPVTVDAFNDRLKDDYQSVIAEIKGFSDRYLDLETNGKWLIRAILELIESDESIKENTKFLVIPGNVLAYRDDLFAMKTIPVYSFLLGIWHYLCSAEENDSGKETYFYLSDYVSEGKPRNLVKSRVGFDKFDDIQLSYSIQVIEEKKNNNSALASLSVEKATGPSHGEVVAAQLFSDSKDYVKTESKSIDFTIEIETPNSRGMADRLLTYLEHAKAKHQMKKTFLYETQRPFYDFFVCNDVKKRATPVGSGQGGSHIPEPAIENITLNSFPERQRFIILSGTGGLGKSMMMTHFMLNTIEKYQDENKVPIFVVLRDYNPENGDILDFVFGEFKRHDPELRLPTMVELLTQGRAVILFDGLDEIKGERREEFSKEVERLVDSYPNSTYVISSRPALNLRAYSRFTVYDLQPFNPEQSVEMIKKLDQSVIDPDIQKDFINDLKANRFSFNYEERTEFLGNPLFLTIMLLTYEGNHDIPTQRFLFYEQAYEAMAKKHDATKALTRDFATGLNSRDFQKYFGEFCAISYEQEKYDFTPTEIEDFFQDVISANDLNTTPEAFIEDITGKVCLIYRDGDKYFFVHRSFQEYFVAYFFSKQIEQHFDAIYEMFCSRDEGDHDSMVLSMLYAMEPQKTELCVIIPFLKELVDSDKTLGYQQFLQRIYPIIRYERGETESYSENEPESSVYKFIVDMYDLQEVIVGDSLPHLDNMVEAEYAYIQKIVPGGDIDYYLENIRELGQDYIDNYEERFEESVEVVGWSYEIDVLRVYGSNLYEDAIKMLEDNKFPLKVEYEAIKKKYKELREKYERTKPRKSFISKFH